MKLFIREIRIRFSFQLGLVGSILLLIWLDGYQNIRLLFYLFFLSLLLICLYWGLHYYNQRKFYKKLTNPQLIYTELNELKTPVGKALDQLFKNQYKRYYQETTSLKMTQKQQREFMDLWIHQMKTPLAVIELLLQEEPVDIESLAEETDRLNDGLMVALTMSRIQNLQDDFVIKPFVISELAKKVIQEHKQTFIRSQVYPKLEFPTTVQIQSDQKWLHFILYQLLSNAIKYSKDGGVVTIYGEERKDSYAVVVKDEGIGIPEADLPKIFQPFFTGENGRKQQEATGMGLYLSEKAATDLGITLSVESKIEVGTSVTLLFSNWTTIK